MNPRTAVRELEIQKALEELHKDLAGTDETRRRLGRNRIEVRAKNLRLLLATVEEMMNETDQL